MDEEEIKNLFSEQKKGIIFLKKNFPRILNAEIKDSALYISFYGADNMEKWLDDYKNLENTLKTAFEKYYIDKQYFTRVITTI